MNDRFQFSIRSLLMLTALVAVSLAMHLWRPPFDSLSAGVVVGTIFTKLVVGIVLMPPAIVASVFSKGVTKAFWIGTAATLTACAFACATVAFNFAMVWKPLAPNPWNPSILVYAGALDVAPVFWCFAPINGLLSALAYRFIWPRRGSLPISSFRASAILWIAIGIAIFLSGMTYERWRAAIAMPAPQPAPRIRVWESQPDVGAEEDQDEEEEDQDEEAGIGS